MRLIGAAKANDGWARALMDLDISDIVIERDIAVVTEAVVGLQWFRNVVDIVFSTDCHARSHQIESVEPPSAKAIFAGLPLQSRCYLAVHSH
jgi:hypothetical protein